MLRSDVQGILKLARPIPQFEVGWVDSRVGPTVNVIVSGGAMVKNVPLCSCADASDLSAGQAVVLMRLPRPNRWVILTAIPTTDMSHFGSVHDRSTDYVRATLVYCVAGDLTVANDVAPSLSPWSDVTIREVMLLVKTAPTGSSIIVDVNVGGTTVFTDQDNRPVIAVGETTGVSYTIDAPSLSKDGIITVDVDQIGSSTAGADLTVQVRVEQIVKDGGLS